jgi:ABC-type transport system substrate-binding protein
MSWRADADLRVGANDQYWADLPALEAVSSIYPEIAARMTALETGELDFTAWRVPTDQMDALRERRAEDRDDALP